MNGQILHMVADFGASAATAYGPELRAFARAVGLDAATAWACLFAPLGRTPDDVEGLLVASAGMGSPRRRYEHFFGRRVDFGKATGAPVEAPPAPVSARAMFERIDRGLAEVEGRMARRTEDEIARGLGPQQVERLAAWRRRHPEE